MNYTDLQRTYPVTRFFFLLCGPLDGPKHPQSRAIEYRHNISVKCNAITNLVIKEKEKEKNAIKPKSYLDTN